MQICLVIEEENEIRSLCWWNDVSMAMFITLKGYSADND